ncbi:ciliary-associated calcium-binding coiled-coil protein 1 [Morus bassanus]
MAAGQVLLSAAVVPRRARAPARSRPFHRRRLVPPDRGRCEGPRRWRSPGCVLRGQGWGGGASALSPPLFLCVGYICTAVSSIAQTEVAELALNELAQDEDRDQDAIGGKKIINRMFLSPSQITALSEQNVEGVQKKLEEFLNFKQLKTSLKEAILLDYYTAGFLWAKEMNFSLIQLSGFMDLLNFLLENLSEKHMTLGDNLKELGKAMAGIGETDSEGSGDLNFFSIEQAKAVIDYLNISLFKHYKLYEYLFHSPREELVISNEHVIELAQPAVPPFPALLEEGMPLDIYSSFIISPTAAETESKASDQEGYLEESCPEVESFEADAVAGVTAEEQKSTVDEMPNEIIGNLEPEINEKLQMQEEAYTLRTEKLKSPE